VLTPANWPAVAELCARLDGLPLAIELAAARGQRLSPQRLLEQFQRGSSSLELLAVPARDRPPRQQTLHATIAWSYEHLSDQEQTLFRRLAVFAGSWTTEAAEAITSAGDTFDALVDKSLVAVSEGDDGEPRFTMLETIREYALERLNERGETAPLRERHAAFFLDLAEATEPHLAGSKDEQSWWAQLQAEQDNLRAALRWALDAHEPICGLRLAGALWLFWDLSTNYREGRGWLAELLACDTEGAAPAQVRAKALNGIAMLALRQADTQAAAVYAEESVALYRAHGDERGLARALLTAGNVAALGRGDIHEAIGCYAEALALQRSVNDRAGMAVALFNLGVVGLSQGDDAQARTSLEEAQLLHAELGSQRWVFRTQPYLAAALLMVGERERAGARRRAGSELRQSARPRRGRNRRELRAALARCHALRGAQSARRDHRRVRSPHAREATPV
jgi:tetratricopeptide (TPR) repeat protein